MISTKKIKRFKPPKTIKLTTNFNWKFPKSGFNFNPKPYNPKPFKKLNFSRFGDFDGDGVPNYKDCQPFNPHKQHNHKTLTQKESKTISKQLLKGRDITTLSFPEYAKVTKAYAKKLPIIQIINGYGIYAQKEKNGEMLYHCVDMNTGLNILNNRKSLNIITQDIKKGQPAELKKRFPEQFDLKESYKSIKRTVKVQKKYKGRAMRFKPIKGQQVLDIGAGSNPDIRATHAIDLVKPVTQYKELTYKYGYDFNKESTNLPYPPNSFDIVVSYGGLGRNFESKNIYKEIYRVLKPGGSIEFNPDSEKSTDWLKAANFKNLHMESYFDENLGKDISIIVGVKI